MKRQRGEQRPAPPDRSAQQESHGEDRPGGIGRHGPVGVSTAQEGLECHDQQRRCGKDRQHQLGARCVPVGTPGAHSGDHGGDDRGNQRDKHNRAENGELIGHERERLARIEHVRAPVGVVGRVAEGGKLVGGVPRDIATGRDREHRQRQPAAPADQRPAHRRVGQDRQSGTCEKVECGVFGQERKGERQAQHHSEGPARPVTKADQGIERARQARHQRHVGRHDP